MLFSDPDLEKPIPCQPLRLLLKESQQLSDLIPLDHNIFITGFPFDEGTKRNGGRTGAEKGSQCFREFVHQSDFPLPVYSQISYCDVKDIAKSHSRTLEEGHLLQEAKIRSLFEAFRTSATVFSIGGSNDQSFPNVSALMKTFSDQKIGVINLDAHFDVRPLKNNQTHSGSPFRQMLESQLWKPENIFIEFANKGCSCSQQHASYLLEKNCPIYWLEKDIRRANYCSQNFGGKDIVTQPGLVMLTILLELTPKVDFFFFSFDVDSIDSQFCPGVSAPSVVGGLTDEEAYELCYLAGAFDKVRLIDFSEFNPAVEKIQTSQLLVRMFEHFCLGLSNRLH